MSEPRALRIAERALKTQIGTLQVGASEAAVLYIELPRRRGSESRLDRWLHDRLLSRGNTPLLRAALAQLREYFAGKRRSFDVPVEAAGTEFQRRVRIHPNVSELLPTVMEDLKPLAP